MIKHTTLEEITDLDVFKTTMAPLYMHACSSGAPDLQNFYEVLELPLRNYLGGDVYILENEDDLSILQLADAKASDIDILEVHGAFMLFCRITNNAGGDQFFIPTSLISQKLSNLLKEKNEDNANVSYLGSDSDTRD